MAENGEEMGQPGKVESPSFCSIMDVSPSKMSFYSIKNDSDDKSTQTKILEESRESPKNSSKVDLKPFPSFCCRICHGNEESEPFISPCRCRGTVRKVHRSCLEAWLAQSDSRHCELCGYVFHCLRIPKYNVFKSIYAWFSTSECLRDRKLLISDIFVTVGLTPIILLFTFATLKLVGKEVIFGVKPEVEDEEENKMAFFALTIMFQSILLGILFFIDLGFISWVLSRCEMHVTNWYKWYRRTSVVVLINIHGPAQLTLA